MPVTAIRLDIDPATAVDGINDILPINANASASNGHWQDLVFAVNGGANGIAVNVINLLSDIGNVAVGNQILNNTTNVAFVDNIIINDIATPLFTARTGLQAIALYAGANTNPLPRVVDYSAAGVTGVTAANLAAVNAAIDAASPEPTTLAAIQAIVSEFSNFVWSGVTNTSWGNLTNWNRGILPNLNAVVSIPYRLNTQVLLLDTIW